MDDVFKPLRKYRIESEKILGDGVSNVVRIERRYSLPFRGFWRRRDRAIDEFYDFDDKEFHFEDVGIKTYVSGWGDCNCKTIDMLILVFPNGDNIVYNTDIDILNEMRSKSVS